MSRVLLVQPVQVILLGAGGLPLLLLCQVHKLLHLRLEAVLVLLFHLCVFLEALSCRCDHDLELLPCLLALTDEVLIFSNVFFEVIKDLKFLVEGNQRVQLVLKFNFLVLEQELKLGVLSMLKHGLCEANGLCLASVRTGSGLGSLLRASWLSGRHRVQFILKVIEQKFGFST